jgi:hypothetical protein
MASLTICQGGAHTGKSTALYDRIKQHREAGEHAILLVPEQATYAAERKLTERLGGLLGVEVYSFERFSERLLTKFGHFRPSLSVEGRQMVLRRAAFRKHAELTVFARVSQTNGFAEVKHLSVEGGNEYLIHRSLVFRLEGYSKRRRLLNRMDDLLNAVGTAGFDPSLWTLYDIIERTKSEDAIRKQGMRQISEEDAQGERAQSKRNEP